jgi:glycosyltransferase involved in cell wall biosynthesis
VFFNSAYHQASFLSALPSFLQQFPDHRELALVDSIRDKSEVLPLGMDLRSIDKVSPLKSSSSPVILWNHRWEYDKNPELFFETLFKLKAAGQDFKLVVLGEAFRHSPKIFKTAQKELVDHILHFGYAETRHQYLQWLRLSDILPVTSQQDFFGGSVVEAIYAGCYPLLPERLAFPEHIPLAKRSVHLYDGDQDLLIRLQEVLPKITHLKQNTSYRNFVAHYDWRILASDYDQRMKQLVSTSRP